MPFCRQKNKPPNMKIQIYHNPRCTKSRQSHQLLTENGVDFDTIEYLKEPISENELKAVLSKLGIKAAELIRKSEAIYKEKFKGKELSENEWIKAMIDYPKLMQRPIVIRGKKAVIGRPTELVAELIK
jgi:arsenate reductase (glutaredoxin)